MPTADQVRVWAGVAARDDWSGSRHHAGATARGEQRPPPGDWWLTWLYLGGRGTGKTRTGVEWAIEQAVKHPRGALVAPTAADVRDTLVEGESGILACAPRGFRPKWEPSKRRLTYPNNCIQTVYSADQPDRLRGPQHHYALVDEWMAMKDPQTLLDMLLLGLRLGTHPQLMIATTPRPHRALKALMDKGTTALTKGTTFDNLANLAPPFREQILSMYEGTRLGRQELEGEVLADVAGALFRTEWIRRTEQDPTAEDAERPALRVVTAVDPAVSTGENADETGIVTAAKISDDEFVVLSDRSGRYTPDEWARVVQDEVTRWGSDRVVAERNQGGDLVKRNLGRITVPVHTIHAKRAKRVRAEPVSRLYEQGKVAHLGGLGEYETQLCLVAGTTIATSRGRVPIEQVKRGDLVWTRRGWAPVEWAGQTADVGTLTTVTHSGGMLISTPWHRVWTHNRGFVPAMHVRPSDLLVALANEPPPPAQLPTGAAGTPAWRPGITEETAGCCTASYGKIITARSPLGTSSTTLTTTRPTTTSPTCNSCSTRTIDATIAAAIRQDSCCGGSLTALSTPSACGGIVSRVTSVATTAAHHSEAPTCVPDGAAVSVDGNTETTRPVYDIKVADPHWHEFFANGVLVHNTEWVPGEGESPDRLDAGVYALTEVSGRALRPIQKMSRFG